jgi:hypothetical protein
VIDSNGGADGRREPLQVLEKKSPSLRQRRKLPAKMPTHEVGSGEPSADIHGLRRDVE